MDNESSDAPSQKNRDVVQAVKLPNREPDRVWGGPSQGGDCVLCGLPIRRGELELEIEFHGNTGNPETERYRVHVHCLPVWRSTYLSTRVVTC
jgi:hypothetical protein